jgi:alkanesulfonate monooxygenase SsuD/methylene tetrahydromethanopterin reductase-like flavin-dependent oxidoreductase (luciferase family)
MADARRLRQIDIPNPPVSIIGSPETCLERILAYRDRIGVTHLLCRVQLPGMGQAESMRRIELLAERVIPNLA